MRSDPDTMGIKPLYWTNNPVLQEVQRPEFVCGWGAAFVNICVTFPINKVMFRQQLYGVRTLKALRQLQKEGIRHMYRGLIPPLLQKTTSMSLMFGLYYEFQRHLDIPSQTLNKASAAMMAGTVESILTPFERIQVVMQDKNYHKTFNNTFHAFRELRQFGFTEYYRGMVSILLRNGPSNVLFFLGRDSLIERYPEYSSHSEKAVLDFISGAFLGAFISTIFYPLNVVKVRIQSKVGGDFCRIVPTFLFILKERDYSMKKMFRGLNVNYTRSFISWGIINATYEFLMQAIFTKEDSDS